LGMRLGIRFAEEKGVSSIDQKFCGGPWGTLKKRETRSFSSRGAYIPKIRIVDEVGTQGEGDCGWEKDERKKLSRNSKANSFMAWTFWGALLIPD